MNKSRRPVAVRFMLVQPEEAAGTRTDHELALELGEYLRFWVGTVDGEVEHLFISIDKSEPAD